MIRNLVRKFSSIDKVGNYNTLISNKLVPFLDKIYDVELVNLNKLEDEFRNYSWYLDSKSGKLYNILISINNIFIPDIYKDNNELLIKFKMSEYFEIKIDIEKLSRNSYLKSDNLFKFSLNSFEGREHYSLNDFSSKTKVINKSKRRILVRNPYENKKRKRSNSLDYKNKWKRMVSASKVRNYLLNDPLLDWLNEFNITSIYDSPKNRISNSISSRKFLNIDDFTKYIMDQGIIFEREVYKILKKKYNIVKVAESYESRSLEKFKKTVKLMKNGVDILYQPVIQDFENGLYGSPDLLVRSDKINDIFGYHVIPEEETIKRATKLNTDYHYLVVDIKHSTLHLNANGKTMRNSNSIPAYKGQIYIYNTALGEIQGYQSSKGFILGKKWHFTKSGITCSGDNFLEKLGEIDFDGFDHCYIEQTKNAINWIRDVRFNGHEWSLLPYPTRKELLPNMKNERDNGWRFIKKRLNEKIDDITSIWMCGVRKRDIAFNKRIYSWKDKNCNSKNLEFKPGKIYDTVNSILDINRQNRKLIDYGSLKSTNNIFQKNEDVLELYLDYETMNSNFGRCILQDNNIGYKDNEFIFLIGVGWDDKGKWKFKEFLSEYNNNSSELKMIQDFWIFINKLLLENKKKEAKFIHWTSAEPINYRKLKLRHTVEIPNKKFYDLYKLFRENNIVVKGALNFSLKTVAKAMQKNELTETVWDETNPCSNGLKAMLLAYKIYSKNEKVDNSEPIINDIIHYNQVDCKVLWEIVNFIRNDFK
jgi:hypothetical protein